MILQLVDDLPLFLEGDTERIEAMASEALARVRFPDDLVWDYLGFADLGEWWSSVACLSSPTMLVGTRPRLLHERVPVRTADVMFVGTLRAFDQAGLTTSASISDVADPAFIRASSSIRVVDDVLMTGRSICSAIQAMGPGCERVDVVTYLSTECGAQRVVETYPTATVASYHWTRYEPVKEGTVIFLWDLLFGNLAGGRALDRSDLLRPFFGRDISSLERLRDDLTRPAAACERTQAGSVSGSE